MSGAECNAGCSLQDEIKKAYRGLALTAHPDKQAAMEPDEAKKAIRVSGMLHCCQTLKWESHIRLRYRRTS